MAGRKKSDPLTQKLNPMQERFVDEYMMHGVGSKAAVAAGYSEATAKAQACNLLALAYIQREITNRYNARRQQYRAREALLIDRVYNIAMNEDARDADALKAAELSGKFLGLLNEKIQHTHYSGDAAIAIDATPAQAIEAYNNLLK